MQHGKLFLLEIDEEPEVARVHQAHRPVHDRHVHRRVHDGGVAGYVVAPCASDRAGELAEARADGAIDRAALAAGAELAFTYQGEALGKRVKPLAEELGSNLVLPCDVEDLATVDAVFSRLEKEWGKMDFLVHSLAYSDKSELKGLYADTSRENFIRTLVISCFSFTEAARRAKLPIFYCTQDHRANNRPAGAISTKRPPIDIQPGDYDIHDAFKPQPQDILIYKQRASIFQGTPLFSHLSLLGIQSLIVCGESTSGCVRASAVDGYSSGFHVSLVEE